MHFFRVSFVSPVLELLPWMVCMQFLQEQKTAGVLTYTLRFCVRCLPLKGVPRSVAHTKKLLFLKTLLLNRNLYIVGF